MLGWEHLGEAAVHEPRGPALMLLWDAYAAACVGNCVRGAPARPPADIQVRLLLSVDRRQSSEEALETARLAVALKDEGVLGLDLSGNPRLGQVGGSGFCCFPPHGPQPKPAGQPTVTPAPLLLRLSAGAGSTCSGYELGWH